MKQILNTLKQSTLKIIIVIVLIVMQVTCDLALPEYTSKIINVGIQQSGITETMPKAITKSTYDKMQLLASAKEKTLLSNYQLVEEDDTSYTEEYSYLKNNDLYILKAGTDVSDLKTLFIASSGLSKSNKLAQMIPLLDYQEKAAVLKPAYTKIKKLDPEIQKQIAIGLVKAEYEKIDLDIKSIQAWYIASIGAKMIAVALLGLVLAIIIAYLSAIIASAFAQNIRKKVVTKVMQFGNKEFQDFSTASLITRSTNDVQQLQMFINMALRIIIYAPILGVGAYMKVSADQMSWVIGVAVAAISMLVIFLFVVIIPKFSLVQKLVDKINLISREIITGIAVIRSFGTHKREEKRFDLANLELTKTNLFVGKVMSLMMPAMIFILNATTVLIIWVGADKVNDSGMQVGTLMAFMAYTMQIIMAFLMISMMSIILPRASVSLKRIKAVLDKEISVTDTKTPIKFDKQTKGVIEFKNVSFKYCDTEEKVLDNISFSIAPQTTTAIIGSTGSGKSTILNLLLRFFDVSEGSIKVDNKDIQKVTQTDLRAKFGYVPQIAHLFSGNITSNLKFGVTKATDNEIKRAINLAMASDFIKDKKDGLKSKVSQGGTNLSGGQKQRLAIARAIIKKPEFLIFDDSFSALDFKTDIKLRQALAKEVKDTNLIIVAQRISSIIYADQIIVLDQGKIAGIGTHTELLKSCKVYQEIAKSQLSKEEILNV